MVKKMIIGPKGQIVIPKEIREKLGIKEYSEVLVDVKGNAVIINKVTPESVSYTDFYASTYAKKLNQKVDLDKIKDEEYEKHILH